MEFCNGMAYTLGEDLRIVHCVDHGPLGTVYYGDDQDNVAQIMYWAHEKVRLLAEKEDRKNFYGASGRPRNNAQSE